MILTVCGLKGGVGKTTIATNLALMRSRDGRRVSLLDADDQRSASEFAEQRMAMGYSALPCAVASGGEETVLAISDLAEQHDDVIVDVGGRDTQSLRAALLKSDAALIPFPPGNYDVWTLPQIEEIVTFVKTRNASLDAMSCISRGYIHGRDNAEATDMLRASRVLRYVDAPILERRVYVRSSGDGLAVIEAKDAKATAEITRLYDAIYHQAAVAAA